MQGGTLLVVKIRQSNLCKDVTCYAPQPSKGPTYYLALQYVLDNFSPSLSVIYIGAGHIYSSAQQFGPLVPTLALMLNAMTMSNPFIDLQKCNSFLVYFIFQQTKD